MHQGVATDARTANGARSHIARVGLLAVGAATAFGLLSAAAVNWVSCAAGRGNGNAYCTQVGVGSNADNLGDALIFHLWPALVIAIGVGIAWRTRSTKALGATLIVGFLCVSASLIATGAMAQFTAPVPGA